MSPGHYLPDQDFAPAPAGARVRMVTLLSFMGVLLLAIAIPLITRRTHRPPPWPVFAGLYTAPAIALAVWLTARIRRYRLAGAELQVHTPFRIVRFPLAGLDDAAPDREALRGARKIVGNDGVGAISGRFKSRRLGGFRAYVTDSERAVVLRWPDRCVVISPDQPAWFVETVRRRAGLNTPR